jgi:SOS response associated peptidase (SRAP)
LVRTLLFAAQMAFDLLSQSIGAAARISFDNGAKNPFNAFTSRPGRRRAAFPCVDALRKNIPGAKLVELYRLTQLARNLEPRYNVAPTTTIDAIRVRDGARERVPMRWGLVPGWWRKSLKGVPATFNARGETVTEKPMFRSAFKRTRYIIPASGYSDGRTINSANQPYYFSASDAGVLSIAGLWDQWNELRAASPSSPAQ